MRISDWSSDVCSSDLREGLKYLHESAAELGFDRRAIAVRGVSAGGGLAAALALLVRDAGDYPIAHLSLLYPMLDDRTEAQAPAGHFVWTARANRFGRSEAPTSELQSLMRTSYAASCLN